MGDKYLITCCVAGFDWRAQPLRGLKSRNNGAIKTLAREYARSGITVNILAPGWIGTPGWGSALDGKREVFSERVPVGRLGLPEDVANAVSFIVSDQAEYITGVTLSINGGLYIS